jgi:O-antigen/teichoic acid export membrane protein
VLEYANTLLTYLLLLADVGIEIWGTREAAQSKDPRGLALRVLPLRLLTSVVAFLLMLALLPTLPDFPGLRLLVVLFGLSVFAQAANLKWLFTGQQKMSRVAAGLVIAQIVFALSVFAIVKRPEHVVWVPILRLASDAALAASFAWQFGREYGGFGLSLRMAGAGQVLRPALVIGAANAMGLLNYNFSSLLLGFLRGEEAVAWFSVAYKPVTIALAIPLTYFIGLFPVLSRQFAEHRSEFDALAARSFRLCAIFAIPLGIGGMFLAEPMITTLFGGQYRDSALPFSILVWSAVFVILRGSYRHSLNASGRQNLDLRSAITSASLNVLGNCILIPRFGMIGAAAATVFGDVVWFAMSCYYFQRAVGKLNPIPVLLRPLLAGAAMAAMLYYGGQIGWIARGATATAVYFLALLLLAEPQLRAWLRRKP